MLLCLTVAKDAGKVELLRLLFIIAGVNKAQLAVKILWMLCIHMIVERVADDRARSLDKFEHVSEHE